MDQRRPSRIKNLSIAGISALTGCVSLIVVTLALFIGLWLDSLMGQRGPATLCLLVLSVPLSLYIMIRMALGLVKQLPPPVPPNDVVSSDEKEE